MTTTITISIIINTFCIYLIIGTSAQIGQGTNFYEPFWNTPFTACYDSTNLFTARYSYGVYWGYKLDEEHIEGIWFDIGIQNSTSGTCSSGFFTITTINNGTIRFTKECKNPTKKYSGQTGFDVPVSVLKTNNITQSSICANLKSSQPFNGTYMTVSYATASTCTNAAQLSPTDVYFSDEIVDGVLYGNSSTAYRTHSIVYQRVRDIFPGNSAIQLTPNQKRICDNLPNVIKDTWIGQGIINSDGTSLWWSDTDSTVEFLYATNGIGDCNLSGIQTLTKNSQRSQISTGIPFAPDLCIAGYDDCGKNSTCQPIGNSALWNCTCSVGFYGVNGRNCCTNYTNGKSNSSNFCGGSVTNIIINLYNDSEYVFIDSLFTQSIQLTSGVSVNINGNLSVTDVSISTNGTTTIKVSGCASFNGNLTVDYTDIKNINSTNLKAITIITYICYTSQFQQVILRNFPDENCVKWKADYGSSALQIISYNMMNCNSPGPTDNTIIIISSVVVGAVVILVIIILVIGCYKKWFKKEKKEKKRNDVITRRTSLS